VPVLISNQVNIWREIKQSEAGIIDSNTQEGTERMIHKWLDMPAHHWDGMRANAEDCFEKRFLIDRTADSFIDAMEVFGMRRSSSWSEQLRQSAA